MPRPLQQCNKVFHNVTTTDDPVIRSVCGMDVAALYFSVFVCANFLFSLQKLLQLSRGDARVFATDAIIATLMTCSRSVYPWDLVVERRHGKLFFDKRDASSFDLLTVNETAQEPPTEDADNKLNTISQLAIEATWINQMFKEQVNTRDNERHTISYYV